MRMQCILCGYIYDEELGDPDEGLAPGTKWDDIPDDWECPDCGAMKEDFVMSPIQGDMMKELWDRIMNYKFPLWKVMVFLLAMIALCIFGLVRAI